MVRKILHKYHSKGARRTLTKTNFFILVLNSKKCNIQMYLIITHQQYVPTGQVSKSLGISFRTTRLIVRWTPIESVRTEKFVLTRQLVYHKR